MYASYSYIYPVCAAFCVSFVVNLLLSSRWLRHIGLDTPDHRSLHQSPTPRLGGLGILGGVLVLQAMSSAWPHNWNVAVVLLAGISLLDDLYPLPPWLRLAIQLGSATAIVQGLPAQLHTPALLALLLPGVIWSINLYNFMDGANGLAGGMGLIGFGWLGWAAWPAAPELALNCWAIAAAAAGFLCFNFGQARIFMGDAGSTLLGLMAATIGTHGVAQGAWPAWLPLMIFSPFIADASSTLLARILRKERFWLPHREHAYQKLIQMGWSHTRLATCAYILMLLCGGLAVSLQQKNDFVIFSWLALAGIYWIIGRAIQKQWNRFVAAA